MTTVNKPSQKAGNGNVSGGRILRRRDVYAFCGLPQTTVDFLIRNGRFPKPLRLSKRSVGWLESELVAWRDSLVRQRDGEAA